MGAFKVGDIVTIKKQIWHRKGDKFVITEVLNGGEHYYAHVEGLKGVVTGLDICRLSHDELVDF